MRLTSSFVRSLILPRRKHSNKGDYGHVLVVAGSKGMPGAPVLCAAGALRSGAGLVTVAVPESQYGIVAKKLRSEAMLLPVPENGQGSFSATAFQKIERFVRDRKVTAVVIGPGIRVNKDTRRLVQRVLGLSGLTVIADADALNALKGDSKALRNAKADLIITPHPGEMGRLTGMKTKAILKMKAAVAKKFSAGNRVVCVLKGSGTAVSDGRKVFENTTGNPGMAKGGSGDVLAGMIGALAAQAREPRLLNAAAAGVYIHGLAGDIAARKETMIGMTAGDMAKAIPAALKKMRFK
jgi:ADP-dependent NAD(P)H-hydrate dehydratase / NAD(P)H-hydrate epimerase